MKNLNNPKVSILMNCYNSSEYLLEAINSIYAQSYQNFEIIFIDNQSTDGSDLIAKKFDERLKYYRTPKFMNLYGARSYGLQYITGDYLAFLDCDDVWMPFKLAHQLKLLSKTNADFVYGGFVLKFEAQSAKAYLMTRVMLALNFIRRITKPSSVHSVNKIIKNYDINLQTAIFDFSKAKGMIFNPNLNLLGDLDFFFRLGASRGFKFCYDRRVVAKYRIHEKQLSNVGTRNWVKEGRYCSLFLYREIFSEEDLKEFRKLVDFFKGNDLWQKGKIQNAMAIKKRLRFRNSTMFLDWVKYSVRSFLG